MVRLIMHTYSPHTLSVILLSFPTLPPLSISYCHCQRLIYSFAFLFLFFFFFFFLFFKNKNHSICFDAQQLLFLPLIFLHPSSRSLCIFPFLNKKKKIHVCLWVQRVGSCSYMRCARAIILLSSLPQRKHSRRSL